MVAQLSAVSQLDSQTVASVQFKAQESEQLVILQVAVAVQFKEQLPSGQSKMQESAPSQLMAQSPSGHEKVTSAPSVTVTLQEPPKSHSSSQLPPSKAQTPATQGAMSSPHAVKRVSANNVAKIVLKIVFIAVSIRVGESV